MKPYLSNKSYSFTFLLLLSFGLIITTLAIANGQDVAAREPASVTVDQSVYLPLTSKPLLRPNGIRLVPIATDFTSDTITDITHANDSRLFVLEKSGIVRIVQPNGTVLPTPFLDITGRVFYDPPVNWELGALGLVFHPDFPQKPYLYISYNSVDRYRIKVERYTVNPDNPNVAIPTSRLPILMIPKSADDTTPHPVHNGGDMAFGPDGYLYIGTGDGGPDPHFESPVPPPDQFNHSQRTDVLLGKVLRIDVDKTSNLPPTCPFYTGADGNNYAIPADNPLVGVAGCDEIWATGLRNAWRLSFDRLTGDLFITDVGEWVYEEINVEPAGFAGGANYGWRCYEGTYDQTVEHPEHAAQCQTLPKSAYTPPTFEYPHTAIADNNNCAITGGFVYRGSAYPNLQGYYVYSDFCSGRVWGLREVGGEWINLTLNTNGHFISTFGEGYNGELYAGKWSSGSTPTLFRIEAY